MVAKSHMDNSSTCMLRYANTCLGLHNIRALLHNWHLLYSSSRLWMVYGTLWKSLLRNHIETTYVGLAATGNSLEGWHLQQWSQLSFNIRAISSPFTLCPSPKTERSLFHAIFTVNTNYAVHGGMMCYWDYYRLFHQQTMEQLTAHYGFLEHNSLRTIL